MLGSSETMWSCCFKSHNWKLNYIKPDNRPLEKERHVETRVFYVLSCREIYDIYIYIIKLFMCLQDGLPLPACRFLFRSMYKYSCKAQT